MANTKKKSLKLSTLTRFRIEQQTAWLMMMCIRTEMRKDNVLLQGKVEADETYIGGSSRKDYDKAEGEPRKRGSGIVKDTVIGAVARGRKV